MAVPLYEYAGGRILRLSGIIHSYVPSLKAISICNVHIIDSRKYLPFGEFLDPVIYFFLVFRPARHSCAPFVRKTA